MGNGRRWERRMGDWPGTRERGLDECQSIKYSEISTFVFASDVSSTMTTTLYIINLNTQQSLYYVPCMIFTCPLQWDLVCAWY